MIVANSTEDRIQVIDKIKDTVRLAGGFDDKQKLSQEAMDSALESLQRFGQRIKEIPRTNVRAVGTNTLRKARNRSIFLKKANLALGHPIEIISGREEARLIYMGVAHSIYNEKERRLVIDIGGGSTELAIGQGYDVRLTESLYMGCVSMSNRYFGNGTITAKKMRKAILSARQELESIETVYKRTSWDNVIGSSGTILAIQEVINSQGWNKSRITRGSLIKLKKAIISAEHFDNIRFDGLPPSRVPVFPGGVAILCAIFDALEIKAMEVSDGALREGLLYELIGRLHDKDIRENTVDDLMKRYNIDTEHANHIEQTVINCFHQLINPWHLDTKNDLKLLRWAAKLHEIGLAIAHNQYHKHGAYLLNNSDLPGFTREEQFKLAFLVRCHRRKFPIEELSLFQEDNQDKILKLCMILRLAVVLHRSRAYAALPEFKLVAKDNALEASFPEGWLHDHPLTEVDLEIEADYLTVTKTVLGFQ